MAGVMFLLCVLSSGSGGTVEGETLLCLEWIMFDCWQSECMFFLKDPVNRHIIKISGEKETTLLHARVAHPPDNLGCRGG